MFYPTIDQAVEEWNNENRQKDIFKAQYTQGYEAGTLDARAASRDELARLKGENNRLTAELEQQYESYNLLLSRFRHLLQSDFIRSFDEYDRIKGDYKRDIKEADMLTGFQNDTK
jgi:hypothetical protein